MCTLNDLRCLSAGQAWPINARAARLLLTILSVPCRGAASGFISLGFVQFPTSIVSLDYNGKDSHALEKNSVGAESADT